MTRVIVLGGSGAVGRVAAKTLCELGAFDRVVVADIDRARAAQVAEALGPRAEAAAVDAGRTEQVAALLRGADVAVNCTGPFYRFARPVLEAAIAEKVPYVDVCDDVDATLELLQMDAAARAAGVPAVIGMGNSPGLTNVLARFAADTLLDAVEAVDIYHAHGGEAFEGPGVVAHRLHGMSMEIPMYLDGELRTVRFFEPDGVALRTSVRMHLIGEAVPVYPYPHPEQITIPRTIACRRVTNRGTVLPDPYFQLTMDVARIGLTSLEPLALGGAAAGGTTVVPREVAIAFLLRERERILRETAFGSQRGCTLVEVSGLRRGEPRTYRFAMASVSDALGEGTGIPAAMGAALVAAGKVTTPGVAAPEAVVNPLDFLALAPRVLPKKPDGAAFDGFVVEKVNADGHIERVDLPF